MLFVRASRVVECGEEEVWRNVKVERDEGVGVQAILKQLPGNDEMLLGEGEHVMLKLRENQSEFFGGTARKRFNSIGVLRLPNLSLPFDALSCPTAHRRTSSHRS